MNTNELIHAEPNEIVEWLSSLDDDLSNGFGLLGVCPVCGKQIRWCLCCGG